jgi:ribosomal protein S18 acetylase RimI-like enzyme
MDFRPLTFDQASDVAALMNRYERHWEIPVLTPVREVEDDLTEPFLDLELDTRGYWLEARLVAYGMVHHRPSGEREERVHLIGTVDPGYRGQGIGRHLLEWELERGTEKVAVCDPEIPWYLRTAALDWIEDNFRLYRRFDIEPVRYIQEMIRALDEPVTPRKPEGVEIIPWDRSLDEQTRTALNEAFVDHWGSTPMHPEAFDHRIGRASVRLDLSFQAVDGAEVVGYAMNGFFPEDEEVTGRREGWVESLGVRRAWRGRGVASALLEHSFNAFLEAGMTHSMLGVDTENPTGAFRVYENVGYQPLHTVVLSQREVTKS